MLNLQNHGISEDTIKDLNQLITRKEYDTLFDTLTYKIDRSLLGYLLNIKESLYNSSGFNEGIKNALSMYYRDIVVELNVAFNLNRLTGQSIYRIDTDTFIGALEREQLDVDRCPSTVTLCFDFGPLECFSNNILDKARKELSISLFFSGYLIKFKYNMDNYKIEILESSCSFIRVIQNRSICTLSCKDGSGCECQFDGLSLNFYDICCIGVEAFCYYYYAEILKNVLQPISKSVNEIEKTVKTEVTEAEPMIDREEEVVADIDSKNTFDDNLKELDI